MGSVSIIAQSSEPASKPVNKVSRYNLAAGVIDGVGWPLGMAIFSTTTLLPEFLLRLHASYLQIGLLPALINLGYLLPGIAVASRISRMRYVRPYLIAIGMVERVPLFILPVVIYIVGAGHPALLLGLFYTVFLAHAIATGFNQPSYWSLIGKLIPANCRGRMFGTAGLIGGCLGLGIGPVTHYFLAHATGGSLSGFAACFLLGALLILLSFLPFIGLREPPSAAPVSLDLESGHHWRDLWRVLRGDRGFRQLIYAQLGVSVWSCAPTFFVAAAHQRLHVGASEIALYTTINVVTLAFGNILWGAWADRGGNKRVLVASAVLLILAAIGAACAEGAASFGLVFGLAALGATGINIASCNMALEFAPNQSDMSFYTATLNGVTAPVRAAAPLIAGYVAMHMGFVPVFTVATVFAVAALGSTISMPEPRRQNQCGRGDRT